MTKLFFTAAFIALLSACSSMSGGMTSGSSGMSRTNEMGSAGYNSGGNNTGAYGNSNNMNGYGGGGGPN